MKLTVKQILGSLFVLNVLGATACSVAGVWGFLSEDVAAKCIYTMVIMCIGLSAAGLMLDRFFKDPPTDKQ